MSHLMMATGVGQEMGSHLCEVMTQPHEESIACMQQGEEFLGTLWFGVKNSHNAQHRWQR